MNLLIINGSPRPKGNTASLLDMVAAGAKAGRREIHITWVHLNDLAFKGCQSCFGCKSQLASGCTVTDDLSPALDAMKTQDAVIIGTPIYMGHVTGQLKCFWDRLFGFMGSDRKSRLPAGRKAVLAVTQGMEDEDAYRPVSEKLKSFLESSGLETRTVVAAGLRGLQEGEQPLASETCDRAREAGIWLSE